MHIDSIYLFVLSFLVSTYPKRLWTLPSQADGAVLERETWSTLHMYRIYPHLAGICDPFYPMETLLVWSLGSALSFAFGSYLASLKHWPFLSVIVGHISC